MSIHLRRVLILLVLLAPAQAFAGTESYIWLEAEQFQADGDWVVSTFAPPAASNRASGKSFLFSGEGPTESPAVAIIEAPRPGKYRLWVRAFDLAKDRPAIRRFAVEINGKRCAMEFGTHKNDGWAWQDGGVFELAKGPVTIALTALPQYYARCDALLLTTSLDFAPPEAERVREATAAAIAKRGGRLQQAKLMEAVLDRGTDEVTLALTPVPRSDAKPIQVLENKYVRMEFFRCGADGPIAKRVSVKDGFFWHALPAATTVEECVALFTPESTIRLKGGFFPQWQNSGKKGKIKVGNMQFTTGLPGDEIWDAAEVAKFVATRVESRGPHELVMSCKSLAVGDLRIAWSLGPDSHYPKATLEFRPNRSGFHCLYYRGVAPHRLDEIESLLLPFMWNSKQLPQKAHIFLQCYTPVPVSLVEMRDGWSNCTLGLAADPSEIPFVWPSLEGSRFAFGIRDHKGLVQPSIFAPVLGLDDSKIEQGQMRRFSFRFVAEKTDWFRAYSRVAHELFGLTDYRRNWQVSLTETIFNEIGLIMSDKFGGWWECAKGPIQIESKNTVTHASPLTALEVYLLTGDPEFYARRTLQTLEYVLSRRSVHHAPMTSDYGEYMKPDMIPLGQPISNLGASVMLGLYAGARGFTPAFRGLAYDEKGAPRFWGQYSPHREWNEMLQAFLLTGDKSLLREARKKCDEYIAARIDAPQLKAFDPVLQFNTNMVPDWWGLVDMYEATGDKRYLRAAEKSAHWMATSLWAQPQIPAGEMTVNPGGEFIGSTPKWLTWYKDEKKRLGFPRQPGDAKEARVPAWLVSQVGLGLEHPTTYRRLDSGCANIFMSCWAPAFLRLYQHTGERLFLEQARNATIGRWGNYPGYYITGFTDICASPEYPYQGPDVTNIYYHHIFPHLAYLIDFLITEAQVRSKGAIVFPHVTQMGYAWFHNRIYGFAPGRIYGDNGVWLWLRRGLVKCDNPQVNFLTAHTRNAFYIIALNEEEREIQATFSPDFKSLGLRPSALCRAQVIRENGWAKSTQMESSHLTVELSPKGITVLKLCGLNISIPLHEFAPRPTTVEDSQTFLHVKPDDPAIGEIYGIIISVEPSRRDAFVFTTATDQTIRSATLRWSTGGGWRTVEKPEFPFEFSIPLPTSATQFELSVETTDTEGRSHRSSSLTLRPVR